MPAIKAYKHDGKIIPVDEAKLGKAYKCPFTGRVVGTKRTYLKHLAELRQSRMHANARKKRRLARLEKFWNVGNFEELVEWVYLNSDFFLDNAIRSGWTDDKSYYESIRQDFWVKITWLDLTWSDSVSNTHNCPHNGTTNWGGEKKDAPRGYPGWKGVIEYQTSHSIRGFSDTLWNGTRLRMGTGSGINENRYGYSTEFFAADWPVIAENREKSFTFSSVGAKVKDFDKIKVGKPHYYARF